MSRPAKLHAFGVKVVYFTCTSHTNFLYILISSCIFVSVAHHAKIFFKIAAVGTQIHAFYLVELGSYINEL